MLPLPPYQIFPLGDSALTIDFGNSIDRELNDTIITLFEQLNAHPLPAMKEAMPAYSSLTICYDLLQIKSAGNQSAFEYMKQRAEEMLGQAKLSGLSEKKILHIPVCYDAEFGIDIATIAEKNNITADEIIRIHTATTYHVFMLGFLPGFAYMGQVDDAISHARKPQPENIRAGSVGIAGRQTGIYPVDSPGGWQIIGRTPLKIFEAYSDNAANGNSDYSFCLFQPGDSVQFYSISKDEFKNIKGGHS